MCVGMECLCNKCEGTKHITNPPSKPNTYWYGKYRKHFTAITGTILHATKTPLQNRMIAIFSVMTVSKGVSAIQLSKKICVQYRADWYVLHRIREAFRSGELKLANVAEVDESYIGEKESKKQNAGRGTIDNVPVVGARERNSAVVVLPVENADGEIDMLKYEQSNLGLIQLNREQRIRRINPESITICHSSVVPSIITRRMGTGQCTYKQRRIILGIVQTLVPWYRVSPKLLHRYANEATMRLNFGCNVVDTIDRMTALVQRVGNCRISYTNLIVL